jgi:uncharacterized protein
MKGVFLETELAGEKFLLLHQKALYRPGKKQLILSDVHLGKASHFRRKGIAMPVQSQLGDLERFAYLLRNWKPKTVLLLGDLFHSEYNREWLWLEALLREYSHIRFILVIGNHDILPEKAYKIPNLERTERIEEERIIFSHSPLEVRHKLNICGHVHPGLEIVGKARQSFRLPCFYYGRDIFIMPAFGQLTGLHMLEREERSDYFLITRDTIVKV